MNKKNNNSIKRVQTLDWEDPIDRRPFRRVNMAEKWFQARRRVERNKNILDH